MLQSIELFSGMGTVSQSLGLRGFQTFRVDFNPKMTAELHADITQISAKNLPGNVAILWASPECTRFSRAAAQRHWKKTTISYRNYDYQPATPEAVAALLMIDAAIRIIKEVNPVVWFIENPVGRIHHTAAMRSIGHYRYFVNYADWDFNHSKETYIFSNIMLPLPTSLPKRHVPGLRSVNGYYNRAAVPDQLVNFLIDHALNTIEKHEM